MVVLVIGSNAEVVRPLAADLDTTLGSRADVEICSSALDAIGTIAAVQETGGVVPVAFVDDSADQQRAVDTLVELHRDEVATLTRAVLVTTRPSLYGIDRALKNDAVHATVTRPWTERTLGRVLEANLATYLLEHAPSRLETFGDLLDDGDLDRARERRRTEQAQSASDATPETPHLLLDRSIDEEEIASRMVALLDKALGHPPRIRVSPNTVLIEEDEDVGGIYLLLDGVVQLTSRNAKGERVLHEQSTGGILGLLSLATHRRAMLECRTVTEVRAIPVTLDQLARALEAEPEFATLLTRVLIGSLAVRLRRSDQLQLELDQSLAELSDARAQLVANARFTTLGELAAGMAHELNNPTAALVRAVAHLADDVASVVDDSAALNVMRGQMDADLLPTAELRARRQALTDVVKERALAEQLLAIGVTDTDDAIRLAQLPEDRLAQLEAAARLGQAVRDAASAAERVQSLVDSLRAYARGDDGRGPLTHDIDVPAAVDSALRLLAHRLDGIDVVRDYASVPLITARPGALQQVWTNLITNAIDSMGSSGRLHLVVEPAGHDRIRVQVIDDGPGVDPAIKDKVFEPRFTTKGGRVEFGLGLGLSISRQIVGEHAGTIDVESEPGNTVFTVELPVAGPS